MLCILTEFYQAHLRAKNNHQELIWRTRLREISNNSVEEFDRVCFGILVKNGIVAILLICPVHLFFSLPQTYLSVKRSAILLAGGLLALFGSSALGSDGAGALGCLTLPFVAALTWRKQLPNGQTQVIKCILQPHKNNFVVDLYIEAHMRSSIQFYSKVKIW